MPLPRSMARFNRVAPNKVLRHITPYVPGFGVVHHVGRKTGTPYRTPACVFARPGGFTLALIYGRESEWTRNVLAAGEADITTRGRDHHVTNPRLVQSPDPAPVPRLVRGIFKLLDVDTYMFVDEPAAS